MNKYVAAGLVFTSLTLLAPEDANAFGRHRHRGSACHTPSYHGNSVSSYRYAAPAYASGSYGVRSYGVSAYRPNVYSYRSPYVGSGYGAGYFGSATRGYTAGYRGYGTPGYGYGGLGIGNPYNSIYRSGFGGYGVRSPYLGPSIGIPGTGLRLGL